MKQFYPTLPEFKKLAKKGNMIPVYTELSADLETPVSAYIKAADEKFSFLLESVHGADRLGRYSFLGGSPSLIFKSKGRQIEVTKKGKKQKYEIKKGDPLNEIKNIIKEFKYVTVEGLPRFCGGLVGYAGYDMIRFFEDIPDDNPDKLNFPDSIFLLTDTLIVFDHFMQKIKIVANVHLEKGLTQKQIGEKYEEAVKQVEKIARRFSKNIKTSEYTLKKRKNATTKLAITSNFTKKAFEEKVKKTKQYIRKGDIVQCVISQRFSVPIKTERLNVYRALRSVNPSPYMFYLNFDDIALIGSSPEIFVRCEDDTVELRPIAGTRKRGKDDHEDELLSKELLADPKERAEHVMLVDLGRNDIGRVAKYGTVSVPEFMVIEKYSHVMHIVSDCVGKLKRGKDSYDLIRAAFPAGTVSGAPKIRAMEIIDEMENVKRGPYAGFVGYLSFSGNLDSCITIRTIVVKNKTAYVQAGAGIVADSDPTAEYVETTNKAKALIKALELANTY